MKSIIYAAAFAGVILSGYSMASTYPNRIEIKTDVVEHGGGCRKSSPPGQCCHMETKTGIVHCH